jgi:hypothetical protein
MACQLCARIKFGQKGNCLRSCSGARATCPYRFNCCFSCCVVWGVCCYASSTGLFEMQEKYAGFIPRIFLKHLAWNPSSRLLSLAFVQAVLRPYNKTFVIIVLNIFTFRSRGMDVCCHTWAGMLKSAPAIPRRLLSSLFTEPSAQGVVPRYVIESVATIPRPSDLAR